MNIKDIRIGDIVQGKVAKVTKLPMRVVDTLADGWVLLDFGEDLWKAPAAVLEPYKEDKRMKIGIKNVTAEVMSRAEAVKKGYEIVSDAKDDMGYALAKEGCDTIWMPKSVFEEEHFIIDQQ